MQKEGSKLPVRSTAVLVSKFLVLLLVAAGLIWLGTDVRQTSAQSERPGQTDVKPVPLPEIVDGEKIDERVLAQIAALDQEKESRTPAQRKMDSRLLYAVKMQRREAIADGVPALETGVAMDADGFIEVDITANVTKELTERLTAIGATVIASVPQYRSITARVPAYEIESIAGLSDVIFIQPRQESTTNGSARPMNEFGWDFSPYSGGSNQRVSFGDRKDRVRNLLMTSLFDQKALMSGSVDSQGDASHRANIGRFLTGTAGAGLKIGVLSDGVASLATSQASGDLPPTVTVLAGQGGTGDEGTAMLQLVYDTAPGAQLYFATASTSIASFAANIKALRTAGCDIIIDDVSFFVESPFQNGQAASIVSPTNAGLIAQAVNDVTVGPQAGALYFSSAANSGNKNDNTAGAWEGDFVDGGDTTAPLPTGTGSRIHNFGASTFNTLTLGGRTYLKWSDPLGASNNDYDIYALNSTGTSVMASSTNIQDGTQDPSEDLGTRSTGQRLVVVKKSTAAARFLHINTNRGMLSISTSGVIYGHNGGVNALSVAATPAGPAVFNGTGPVGPFPYSHSSANVVETFSSDGPRRIFYNADSTEITPGNVGSSGGLLLQKPDFTAADGISTTVTGFLTFFGTSAAAPVAGALTALLKTASPSSTNAQVVAALKSTALDIEAPGVDRDSGAGIIMPIPAMAALGVSGNPYIDVGVPVLVEVSGNANGKIEPGEVFDISIPLTNIGLANANGLSGTLTTSIPGVTITQGTQPYPSLSSVNGSATNVTPYRFELSPSFACGRSLSFTLTSSYSGAGGPQVSPFSVDTGTQSNVSTTLDTVTPSAGPGFVAATGTQTGRLNRNGTISSCAAPKATPILQDAIAGRRFDSFTYTASAAGCVSVTIVPSNATALYSAAYTGTYNSGSIQTNYLADYGVTTAGTIRYSFNVTAGQKYVIVVHEVNQGGGIGVNYTLNVAGPADGVCNVSSSVRSRADFDGDGRSDVSVFRPADGNWYQNNSTTGFSIMQWGANGDVVVPGDYDGDGKADFVIWRPSNALGTADFYVLNSNGFTISGVEHGIITDVPVAGDFDGDGRADFAVFRPSINYWFIYNAATASTASLQFGAAGDVPFAMDNDGDGKSNLAVFRPSTNFWYIARPTGAPASNYDGFPFGIGGDVIVPADYDGDNKDDVAVFRPSNGVWYVIRSLDGVVTAQQFGTNGDVAVPGDYDGDGKDDVAVYRGGIWYINSSTSGFTAFNFGLASDVPVAASYHP